MDLDSIPPEYRGWWRITETSQWSSKFLDSLGPAMLSLTGHADRLRMHCLLAYVNCNPTKTGSEIGQALLGTHERLQLDDRRSRGQAGRKALRGQGRTEGNRWFRFVRAGQPALFTFASSWPVKPTTSA